MDYYTAMEEAMIDAAEASLQPTELTRDQMLSRIVSITFRLSRCMASDSERIILCADRHELRLRLLRAEQVAQRLLGRTSGK